MAESDWLSAHAFYHDDLDRLLLGAVAPLVERLTPVTDGWFYLRYWDGGPHLRLRVRPAAGTDRDHIAQLVAAGFAAHFAADPARRPVDAAEYRRTARDLADLERLPDIAELRPNNSLAFLPYRRELDRYGPGPAIEAVERHFVASSRIALDIVAGAPAPRRAEAAFAMLLLAWFTVESDVDTVLARNRRFGARQPRMEPDAAQLDRATDLARRMRTLAGRATEITANGALIEWARAAATLRDDLGACGHPPDRVAGVLDDCAHLLCNRLGVPIATEGGLRALAGAALGAGVAP